MGGRALGFLGNCGGPLSLVVSVRLGAIQDTERTRMRQQRTSIGRDRVRLVGIRVFELTIFSKSAGLHFGKNVNGPYYASRLSSSRQVRNHITSTCKQVLDRDSQSQAEGTQPGADTPFVTKQ